MKALLSVLVVLLASFSSPIIAGDRHPAVHRHETKEVTVYITRTGSKYHRGYCQYLRRSKISISKKEAIAEGYTACSVCVP